MEINCVSGWEKEKRNIGPLPFDFFSCPVLIDLDAFDVGFT